MIKWVIIVGIAVITLALLQYHAMPVVGAVVSIFRSEPERPDELEAEAEASAPTLLREHERMACAGCASTQAPRQAW